MQPSVHVELATRLTPGSISLLHWTNARLEAICRFPQGARPDTVSVEGLGTS
jgi:hypothetical protein